MSNRSAENISTFICKAIMVSCIDISIDPVEIFFKIYETNVEKRKLLKAHFNKKSRLNHKNNNANTSNILVRVYVDKLALVYYSLIF